jgi:FkbM family methyltransferase
MLHKMMQWQAAGMDLQIVLDIGSYHGQFGDMVNSVWPNCRICSIEANPQHESINPDQITVCLSDTPNRLVEFYSLRADQISTGASYYREQTHHYQNPVVEIMRTTTLDVLSTQIDLRGNWQHHGLIKMDTQGSELDILQGGINFIKQNQVRWLLIETSHQNYNLGAPTSSEVVSWLWNHGYAWRDLWDAVSDTSGLLLQTDLLFERLT